MENLISVRDILKTFLAVLPKFTLRDACALLFAYGLPHIEVQFLPVEVVLFWIVPSR